MRWHSVSLVTALVVAGCGDDGGDTSTTGETTADSADSNTNPTQSSTPTTTQPTTAGDSETDSDSADDPDAAVWETPYCFPVRNGPGWPDPLPSWEDEVLTLVNEARATGKNCGSEGNFGPTHPLTMDASLRCAARKHSHDMATRNYFNHTSPDGETFSQRIDQAGYGDFRQIGENIAAGTMSPKATVDGWLGSDGHCANMLSPNYSELGVGAYEGAGDFVYYWTQTFGEPL